MSYEDPTGLLNASGLPDPTARAAERNVDRDELSRLRERVGELSAENRRLRSALRKWASESLRGAESGSESRGRRSATTNPNDNEKAARRDESASRVR